MMNVTGTSFSSALRLHDSVRRENRNTRAFGPG